MTPTESIRSFSIGGGIEPWVKVACAVAAREFPFYLAPTVPTRKNGQIAVEFSLAGHVKTRHRGLAEDSLPSPDLIKPLYNTPVAETPPRARLNITFTGNNKYFYKHKPYATK